MSLSTKSRRATAATLTCAFALAAAAGCAATASSSDANGESAASSSEAVPIGNRLDDPGATRITGTLIREPRALAGVTLGSSLDAVQAGCAAAGWTCVRRARASAVERLHVTAKTGD